MILPIVLGFASILLLWRYFRTPEDAMEIVIELEELDPRDIDYLSDSLSELCQDAQPRANQSPRSPESDSHPSPSIGKQSNQLSCLANAETYVIRQEPEEGSLTSASWEENNVADTGECLAREISASYLMLDGTDSDTLMPQRSESPILKMH